MLFAEMYLKHPEMGSDIRPLELPPEALQRLSQVGDWSRERDGVSCARRLRLLSQLLFSRQRVIVRREWMGAGMRLGILRLHSGFPHRQQQFMPCHGWAAVMHPPFHSLSSQFPSFPPDSFPVCADMAPVIHRHPEVGVRKLCPFGVGDAHPVQRGGVSGSLQESPEPSLWE